MIEISPMVAIGAVFSYTASLCGLVWWLASQFSSVRSTIAEKITAHEQRDEERFNILGMRLLKVEIMTDPNGKFVAPGFDNFDHKQ